MFVKEVEAAKIKNNIEWAVGNPVAKKVRCHEATIQARIRRLRASFLDRDR